KTKQLTSDEFAVVGYTAPKGSRSGFGSLLLAQPDAGHGWRYVGRVGTGFTDALIGELAPRLAQGGRKTPTVHVGETDTDLRSATWFEPRFVVEVFYRGIGRQGLLRQASLKAVRPDKDVGDLGEGDGTAKPDGPAKARGKARAAGGATAVKAAKSTKVAKPADAARQDARPDVPQLSSPEKVLFPDIKATKR